MPLTTPSGTPGNLTADQEAKLQELWLACLEVFGVSHDNNGTPVASGTSTPSQTDEPTKKKKSRRSLFGKKGHSKDNDSDGAFDATAGTDSNDKHGQTKEFQQALASQTPETLRNAFWAMAKHDNPDALLLRFLRARKWDVHNALVMLVSTMHWRAVEMHVDDDIMLNGELHALRQSKSAGSKAEQGEGADFLAQMRMGKSFLHGVDREGRPMCFVRVRLHRQGEQSEKSLERYTVYTIETARMMLKPPVDTAHGEHGTARHLIPDSAIYSKKAARTTDTRPQDYTPVKFMIKCFEANYPESLGSVLVYKAPWIFQGIWKIIKGWLDPVVAAKVHFASNEKELAEFVPIERVPRELGGQEAWEYRYVEPSPDEDAQMRDVEARRKWQGQRDEL
ncbi:phosphatidylinositol transfer protein csr1, partial [Elasticomyces elasticus]